MKQNVKEIKIATEYIVFFFLCVCVFCVSTTYEVKVIKIKIKNALQLHSNMYFKTKLLISAEFTT